MIRILATAFNALPFAFLATIHAVLLFAYRPLEERHLPDQAPMVIVLGGATFGRYELGLQLIEEGRSDWIHFSGGNRDGSTGQARLMHDRAEHALSRARITFEDRSATTLQNAYFTTLSLGAIPPGSILVTDATHLFRAWLAFKWAGVENIHLAPANELSTIDIQNQPRRILREAVSVWLNIGRVALFSIMRAGGDDSERSVRILAERPLS